MKEIAIVGGGIAGLTTAHALRQAGYGVRVFERADHLRASGSGITMQANAMAALESIGLDQAVRGQGYPIEVARIASWSGKVINDLDIEAIAEVVGQIGVAIHRSRLINLLAEGLEDVLEFGAGVVSAKNIDGSARLELDDGRTLEFDAIIGCDGLHSAVRRSLFGEDPLRYAGYTTWRGIANISAADVVFSEYWGPARRFGLVPIGDDEVYWFAVTEAPEGQTSTGPMLDEVISFFGDWGGPIPRALQHTNPDEVFRTDSHDRAPTDTWVEGRIALLGDAAHAMTPNLGQGGGQAVESAVVLGRTLASTDDIETGLRRYEEVRQKRAHQFVDQSWRMGSMAQWKNGLARGMRDFGLRLTPKLVTRKMLIDLYDFEGWYDSRISALDIRLS